jgi:hypothetical protein
MEGWLGAVFFMFWTLGDARRQNPTLQIFLATSLAKGPPTSISLAMTPSTVNKPVFGEGPSPQLNMATQRHSTVIRLLLLPFLYLWGLCLSCCIIPTPLVAKPDLSSAGLERV